MPWTVRPERPSAKALSLRIGGAGMGQGPGGLDAKPLAEVGLE